jgi:hypothetical protein
VGVEGGRGERGVRGTENLEGKTTCLLHRESKENDNDESLMGKIISLTLATSQTLIETGFDVFPLCIRMTSRMSFYDLLIFFWRKIAKR